MTKRNHLGSGLIRLRIALPVFFSILLIISGAAIFLINYSISLKSLEEVAFEYLAKTGDTVVERTVKHLSPAMEMAKLNAKILDPEEFEQDFFGPFNLLTIPQFSNHPQFALVYFGSEQGNFWMNGRDPDGSISTQTISRLVDGAESDTFLKDLKERQGNEEVPNIAQQIAPYLQTRILYRSPDGRILRKESVDDYIYDPRWRPWYNNARQTGSSKWTSAYRFSSSGRYYASGKVGVTVSSPVFSRDGVLSGVVGVDIFLEELNAFLKRLDISPNGRAYIATPEGRLIAYGGPETEFEAELFSGIEDIADRAARMSFASYVEGADAGNQTQFRFDGPEGLYLAYFSPISSSDGPPWVIGVIAPEDDFIGDLKSKLILALLIAGGVLLLAVILSIIIGNRITLPIMMLMRESMLVKDFNLGDNPPVASSFREIADMNAAFQNMKMGLRSFKKYIPGDVVRYLINSGSEAALGGVTKELTIFFSDVADFTTISEQLSPMDLVGHLGDYLGEYSRIIRESGGTVDKYIGDAVMAFWNAPEDIQDHAVRACGAALDCVSRLKDLRESWHKENLPILKTRIGLHTGEVIVGNMGSTERLNYTVIGDSVNLASRLEGLAKTYGVSILASEVTKSLSEKRYLFRRLDKVVVKGKTVPVTVHELLSAREHVSGAVESWMAKFEAGLEAYFNQEWDEAERQFSQSLIMNPTDRAARLYLGRIRRYRQTPPPADWNGTAVFTRKG